jgi:Na+/proline symporter/signal transduction histidine kinase
MMSGWTVAALALVYICILFAIAYAGDRLATAGKSRPNIYALTLAVYCTSWTFFGSIGFAASSGLDFIAVYLGPIIAFTAGLPLLRQVTRTCKTQNITSVADFLSARYGKNPTLSGVVTVVAIISMLPYIALQLKAIAQSSSVLLGHTQSEGIVLTGIGAADIEFVVALGLAAFAILFGARHADAREHQRGLMLAVAVESLVKLAAFIAVGLFVVFGMFGGLGPLVAAASAQPSVETQFSAGLHGVTLLTITLLSFICIFVLPRQFHVTFVENQDERELSRAAKVFPAYLILINLFVVPVAVAGLIAMPKGTVDQDMYLIALPLNAENPTFALIAFVGGLSAAAAMVIVETVALSIMVCNDLTMPILLRRRGPALNGANKSALILNIRRAAIVVIVLLAYVLYKPVERAPLAAIGLLAFSAIAQLGPAFFGGLIWRRATARGAIAGICVGFAVWAYTLLVPYLIEAGFIGKALMDQGPWGLSFLKPQKMFYLQFDPLTHGVVLSLLFNTLAYVAVSLLRAPQPIERLQANFFIQDPTPTYAPPPFRPWKSIVTMDDLIGTVARYLGIDRTRRSFEEYASSRGFAIQENMEADIHAVRFTENLLASAIGAASSRLVMSLTLRRRNVGVNSALRLLDDASEAIQYNRDLLQTALDHVRQGLAVFDKDMRLICWNRQYREILLLPPKFGRFGIPLDEIVRFMAQRTKTDRKEIEHLVTDRITKYLVTRETFQERLIDGRVIEVRTNAMPQGGIVVTYMDITERVIAADALARAKDTLERRVAARTAELVSVNRELELARANADEANLSKTRFLAAASHDILQPLNAARLYVTSLVEKSDSVEQGRIARNIDASLEAVEDILNALLDISRLDTGAMRPEIGTFPINTVLDQLRIDFEPFAKARGLELKILPSAAFVRSDRRLLRRIAQNLVSNSLKYTQRGGVVVGCRRQGTDIRLCVYDTGPGIPDHARKTIFQEFQRLHNTRNTIPGLGLGLSIVDRMCKVLDHKLTLNSVMGRGSMFSVTVPQAKWQEADRTWPAYVRAAGYGDLRGTTILCIDNERSILDSMTALLEGWQCRVLTAIDADDALHQLDAAKVVPDVILSDYHLDEGDGLSAANTVQETLCTFIPTVIITADRSPEVRARIFEAEALLLQKPVKPAGLRAILAQTVTRRQAAE